MKLDIATSILASLLVAADPVMAAQAAAARRQEKERIMDKEHLEEMKDDTNKHHQQNMNENHEKTKSDIHYEANSRKKKEKMLDSQVIEAGAREAATSNNKLDSQSHFDEQQTVASHNKVGMKQHFTIDTEETPQANGYPLSIPDVGILESDTAASLMTDRNLRRRRKRAQKQGPTTCFQEIPIILRNKPNVVFTQPYCDEKYGKMCYWDAH